MKKGGGGRGGKKGRGGGGRERLGFVSILFGIGVLSCLGHKEFRFLLPFLPLSFVLMGGVVYSLLGGGRKRGGGGGKGKLRGYFYLFICSFVIFGFSSSIFFSYSII